MGVSEEPLVISPTMTNLPEGYNIQTVQTVTLEETNATQYQTLITVPFTEIVVLDQSQVKTLLTPDVQLVIADASGQSQVLNESSMVIYVPQEVATNNSELDADTQVARQWYEDSLVATQALSSLTQALSQILSDEGEEVIESDAQNETEAKEN